MKNSTPPAFRCRAVLPLPLASLSLLSSNGLPERTVLLDAPHRGWTSAGESPVERAIIPLTVRTCVKPSTVIFDQVIESKSEDNMIEHESGERLPLHLSTQGSEIFTVPVEVVLGELHLTLEQLLSLQPGTELELACEPGQQIRFLIAGEQIGTGRLEIDEQCYRVVITESPGENFSIHREQQGEGAFDNLTD